MFLLLCRSCSFSCVIRSLAVALRHGVFRGDSQSGAQAQAPNPTAARTVAFATHTTVAAMRLAVGNFSGNQIAP
jgi:hypothetical protein